KQATGRFADDSGTRKKIRKSAYDNGQMIASKRLSRPEFQFFALAACLLPAVILTFHSDWPPLTWKHLHSAGVAICKTIIACDALFFALALAYVFFPSIFRFTVFDAPNTNITEVRMINDRGDVVGVLFDSTQSNKVRGFVREAKGGFIVFDAEPEARDTEPAGINARGDVAGIYIDMSQNNKGRGFVRDKNGNTAAFDAPNASVTFSSC